MLYSRDAPQTFRPNLSFLALVSSWTTFCTQE